MKEDLLEEFMKNIRVWPFGGSINTEYYEQDLRDACRSKQFNLFKGLVDKTLNNSFDNVKFEALKRITIVKFEKSVFGNVSFHFNK